MSKLTNNTTNLQALIQMANNLPVPIDTSSATATPSTLLSGYTAVVNNELIAGNIPTNNINNITIDGPNVSIESGYYKDNVNKTIPIITQATPNISINNSGLITASSNQDAGYVASGTKSSTKQLTTQAAKTVTPGTSDQTAVSSGVYTTGAVTVKGDANLKAENILSGKSIFGVSGGIPNNGSVSATIDGLTQTQITIPAGYTSGGTISLTDAIESALAAL